MGEEKHGIFLYLRANMTEKNINVPVLARVEGEGALDIQIRDNKLTKVNLRIFEPPRLFEKFLEGREPNEVIDAVARICGICPIAYQMSAAHALESIFDMHPHQWIRTMRRAFYCGEWIESHAIHIHMLAGPEFMGYPSALEMAKDHPEVVKNGMKIHGLGNELMSLFGKRGVHPVGACVGGFYFAPTPKDVKTMLEKLETHLPLAEKILEWTASLDLPQQKQDFTCVCLRHPDEYAINEGRIVSSKGLDIIIDDYEQHFQESQSPHSTALHSHLHGKPYLVGPLARVNLNYDLLPDVIKTKLKALDITFPSYNMFHSIIARAVEIYYAMLEAIRILRAYVYHDQPAVAMTPKASVGFGCTEAPRGLLWHRYETLNDGRIKKAKIVPPTSQNQARIEEDLRTYLENYGLHHDDEKLRFASEVVIRNYDPCISCSTHFLTLRVDR